MTLRDLMRVREVFFSTQSPNLLEIISPKEPFLSSVSTVLRTGKVSQRLRFHTLMMSPSQLAASVHEELLWFSEWRIQGICGRMSSHSSFPLIFTVNAAPCMINTGVRTSFVRSL